MMAAAAPDCPDDEALDAFVAGRLDPPSRRAIEQHVDACPSCSRLVVRLFSRTRELGQTTVSVPGATDAVTPPHPQGQRFGRYLILEELGAGGMGRVLAAYDTGLERKVALKLLPKGRSGEAVARLLREASIMAKLSHPNVVTVFDAGTEGDEPYIAMELVAGQTLRDWRKGTPDRPRSAREISAVLASVARGLAAAHAAGIVHCDVKPHNVLVDETPAGTRVRVTDFGLSVAASSAEDRLAGTPGYMAPEQIAGGTIDARTDVFAFSATLYQMFHGVLPFAADSLDELLGAIEATRLQPAAPGALRMPPRVHRLMLAGLRPKPEDRPATLAPFIEALGADPALVRRRVLFGTAVGVAAVAATWGGIWVNASPLRRCRAESGAIAAALTPGARGEIAQRFQQSGMAGAWAALAQRIDAYTQRWRSMHEETCVARHDEQIQSAPVFDSRMVCLAGQRADLAAFTQALAGATAGELAAATRAGLPDLTACAATAHVGVKPPPTAPDRRAALEAVQASLANVAALNKLGKRSAAIAAASPALDAARKLGHEPLLAQALLEQGMLEFRLRDDASGEAGDSPGRTRWTGAMELLEEAFRTAERGFDDHRRAVSARNLAAVHTDAGNHRDAELWGEVASAIVTRLGDPKVERGAVEYVLAGVRAKVGRHEEAKRGFQRALDLFRAVDPRDPDLVAPMGALCGYEIAREAKVECLRRLLAHTRATWGADHPEPDLALHTARLGQLLTSKPETEAEGCALIERARKLLDASGMAETHPRRLFTFAKLGGCLRRAGKDAEARRLYESLVSRADGAVLAYVHIQYGAYLRDGGDFAGAERQLRSGLARALREFGAADSKTVDAAFLLAGVLAKQGDHRGVLAATDPFARVTVPAHAQASRDGIDKLRAAAREALAKRPGKRPARKVSARRSVL